MENKIVKWGILSTGRIAKKFAEALSSVNNSELYAVASRNLESAQQFAEEYNVPRTYGSYVELMQDPMVDVIYIATPHNLHFQNTMDSLKHGKHVLCEKPFAINYGEVSKMIDKAKEKNLFLMEALWSRFLPNIIKTKELIDSGVIGKVKLVNAAFCILSQNGNEHRHFNKTLGGGTLLDIGIYNVFLSLFLLGKPKSINSVAGIGQTGVDTNLNITFKYDDDLISVMYSSFLAASPIFAEIHGEKGKIILEHVYFCPGKVKVVLNNGEETIHDFNFIGNGYNYEAQEVVNCILNGETESKVMSFDNSIELIKIMDEIRNQIGLVYPQHD
jgi:predicted dehydrogenase